MAEQDNFIRNRSVNEDILAFLDIIVGLHSVTNLFFEFYNMSGYDLGNTDKPTQLITMLTQLKEAFRRYDIDLTQMPLTLDSWFVSEPLRHELYGLGFEKIIIAGKGNYTFTINNRKQKASM